MEKEIVEQRLRNFINALFFKSNVLPKINKEMFKQQLKQSDLKELMGVGIILEILGDYHDQGFLDFDGNIIDFSNGKAYFEAI